jgi:uncharacterized protein (DUF2062 family)/2-polyprenyl-3-methyl-5-hydroxy-6-metoxy-1,4-benzoquinol methylase
MRMTGDVREKAKKAWTRLRGGELNPARAAASVAIGLAIGVTPLYGAHLLLVLAVCLPLRLDAPLAYLAANISIPLVAPFLTMAEVELGAFALTGHALPTDIAILRARGAGLLVKELAIGTALLSPTAAAVGGALTFAFGTAWRRARAPARTRESDGAIHRVAERYAASGSRATYHYVRSKLASDPVAERVARLGQVEPLGEVIDAGCGRGQLSVLLLERGLADSVRGFDWDAKKVERATYASRGLPATFSEGDLRAPIREPGDTALLIDVLHYLAGEEQDAVLRNVARAARRMVIVRELDPERGWRSAITRLQEALTTGLHYNRGARVHVRPIADMVRVLEDEGFAAEVSPCWGSLPFANVLVVARRARPA